MSRLRKTLLILIVAQLVCLACGLWIQEQFHDFSASWQSDVAATAAAESAAIGCRGPGSSALATRFLAFLWIGVIQAGIAALMLMHINSRSVESESRTNRELLQRERELLRTRNAVVFGLAKLAEYRDRDTGQHLERIALYSNCLALALRRDPRYHHQITPSFVKTIGISSALHDIGKVAIEDSILNKPGPLEARERERMKDHTLLAGECIRQIERHLGASNFLQMAREIALCHHERWDGTGYPHGLVGEAIPLAARIVAIADIYDALSSRRVYKPAYSHDHCVRLIRSEAGKHLDPLIVEVFLSIHNEFREISERFADYFGSTTAEETSTIVCIPRVRTAQHQVIHQVLDLEGRTKTALTTAG